MYEFYLPGKYDDKKDYSNLILDGHVDLSDLAELKLFSPDYLTLKNVDKKAVVDWESIYQLNLTGFNYPDFNRRFEVDLSHMKSLKDVFYKAYGKLTLPSSLEYLRLGKYSHSEIGNMSNLTKLKHLGFMWAGKLQEAQFEFLVECGDLRVIGLSSCHQLETLDFLRDKVSLKGLAISDCKGLVDTSAIKSLCNLEHLFVGGLSHHLDPDIFTACKSLKSICLGSGARIKEGNNKAFLGLVNLEICEFSYSREYVHSQKEIETLLKEKNGHIPSPHEFHESQDWKYENPWIDLPLFEEMS